VVGAGRSKYKFASFWNRNQALRALEKALKEFTAMQEAAKKVFSISLSSILDQY